MDVISYKCPKCSATLAFNIDKQKWVCDYCNSEFTKDDLSEFETQKSHGVKGDEYEEEAIAYKCPSCGAKIVTDKNTAATFCIYCHNATVIAARLEGEHRPSYLIPFQLKKEAAIEAVKKLCKNRPLLPKDFNEYAMRGEVAGLYVPFWLFNVDLDAQLNAKTTKISVWSDSNYNYTKTDVYHVERAGNVSFANVPADGSKKMDDKLMESLEPFDYSKLDSFEMEYLSGHFAESYDVEANEAYGNVAKRVKDAADSMIKSTIQGYSSIQVINQSINDKNIQNKNVMLPIWTLMAKYKDKNYVFAMNGQTGKITGKLPLSKTRLAVWFFSIFMVVFLICFFGVMLI